MSIVNNSNFNMPSLNGLVDINADSVQSWPKNIAKMSCVIFCYLGIN